MTPQPLDGQLRILRRVRPGELSHDQNAVPQLASTVFRQGGPDGDVSVYLASETTPEFITRNHPGYLVIELTIAQVRSQGLDVQREEIPGDPGHCNITGRKTRGISRTLADICRWSPGFGPPPPAP